MRSKNIFLFLIGGAIGLIFVLLFWQGIFSGPENFFEDLLFSTRPASGDVVILAVDNESLEKIGQWPWPRAVFGQTLSKLNEKPPLAVALDIVFAEPSRRGPNDDNVAAADFGRLSFPLVLAAEANNLFLPEKEKPTADFFVEPLAIFSQSPNVSLGLANVIADKDGVVRRFPVEARGRQSGLTRRALALETVTRSGRQIPNETDLLPNERIVFSGPAGSTRTIPFWRAYQGEATDELEGKVVFVGATASDLHDSRMAPFGREKEMSGAEIQGQIAESLLAGWRLRPLNKILNAFWIFFAALLPALLFSFFKRARFASILAVLFGLGQLWLVVWLFQKGLVANLLHLTLAWFFSLVFLIIFRYFVGEKEKRRLKAIFSKYVSPDVVREILKNPERTRLGGAEKEITVLFSDIRSFTTFSETVTPTKLVEILNRYFTAMTEEIIARRGLLDKYIGDAIMAFWGAPLADERQADNAVEAALAMSRSLKKLNDELAAEGEKTINIGIGIYTGPAVVGNIGSDLRLNYTAMGDTVNVASRLEGLNKEYGTRLIVGEATVARLKGKYDWKFLAAASVKGRKEPVNIFTLEA